jgi:hypothetical protein
LLSTLLRMLLAPEVLGAGWREPLSMYLALAAVALPVYGATARTTERLARGVAAEERTLARRIYLYVALLFGISATITALVWLVWLVLQAMLGASTMGQPAEIGRWAGYAIIGAAIAAYYTLLVRRAGAAKGDIGAGVAIAVLADEPLRQAILATVAREAPGAAVRMVGEGAGALGESEILIVALPELLDGPWAAAARGYAGRRLLLAAPVAGYTLVGARRGSDPLVREMAGALKALLGELGPAPSRAADDSSPPSVTFS